MALGQELGLVLPAFAHAGVVTMLQHMWKEQGWGRACSRLGGRGKKRESCLKQKILPVDVVAKGRSRAGTGAATLWPLLTLLGQGLGLTVSSAPPFHPLCFWGQYLGVPWGSCAWGRAFQAAPPAPLQRGDLPSPCLPQGDVSGAQRRF